MKRTLVGLVATFAITGVAVGCGNAPGHRFGGPRAGPAGPSTTASATATAVAEADKNAHAWKVFQGEVLVLEISDVPGPLLSTAGLPPGVKPATHPFLTGAARSAAHENKLRELLVASNTLPEFLQSLRANGFEARPVLSKP